MSLFYSTVSIALAFAMGSASAVTAPAESRSNWGTPRANLSCGALSVRSCLQDRHKRTHLFPDDGA
jgi:hypothetical protein